MVKVEEAVDAINASIRAINKQIVIDIANNPNTKVINLGDVDEDRIKNWLLSKHSSTWSIFSIGSEDSLGKAANWFAKELDSFYAYLYQSA